MYEYFLICIKAWPFRRYVAEEVRGTRPSCDRSRRRNHYSGWQVCVASQREPFHFCTTQHSVQYCSIRAQYSEQDLLG